MALEAKQDRQTVKQDRSYQSKRVVISCGGGHVTVLAKLRAGGTVPWSKDSTVLSSASTASLSVWAPIMSGLSQSLLTDLPASAFSAPIQQPKWLCYNVTQIMYFPAQILWSSPSHWVKAKVITTAYLWPSMTWLYLLQALSPFTQPCTTTTLSHKLHPHPTLPPCWTSNMQGMLLPQGLCTCCWCSGMFFPCVSTGLTQVLQGFTSGW